MGLHDDMATVRSQRAGAPKKIADEGMTEVIVREAEIKRPYLFFSASEYEATFGKSAPKSKKAKTITMPSVENDTEERLWFFADDGHYPPWLKAHRKGFMNVRKSLTHHVKHLPGSKHKFKRQAPRLINHHLKDKGYDTMSKKGKTITSERRRLAAVAAGEPDDSDDSNPDPGRGSGPAVGCNPDGPDSGPDPGSCPPQSIQSLRAPEQRPEVTTATEEGSSPQPVPSGPSASAGQPGPSSPGKLKSLQFKGDHGSPGLGADTVYAETCAGSDNEVVDEFTGDDTDIASKVSHRVRTLHPTRALLGKKMGNQERQARDLLKALMANSTEYASLIVQLKSAMALQELAKEISISKVKAMSDDVLNPKLVTLKQAGTEVPAEYEHALFSRYVTKQLELCKLSSKPSDLTDLLERCMIWGDSTVNISKPCLSALSGNTSVKVSNFEKYVLHRAWVPLIVTGSAKSELALQFAADGLARFESMPEDLELSDTTTHTVMDWMTCWRGLIGIGNDQTDLDQSQEDSDATYAAVLTLMEMAAQAGSKNIKALVGAAIMSDPFWKAKLNAYLAARTALTEVGPKVKDATNKLESGTPGTDEQANNIMKASEIHLQAADAFRPGAWLRFSNLLLAKTGAHVEKVINSSLGGKQKLDLLNSASRVVAEVSNALPEEVLIVDMTAEIANAIRQEDSQLKEHSMRQAIADMKNATADTIIAQETSISDLLTSCQGSQQPSNADEKIQAFGQLSTILLDSLGGKQPFDSQPAQSALNLAYKLAPFLGAPGQEETAMNAVTCWKKVRDLYNDMHSAQAYNDKGDLSFACVDSNLEAFTNLRFSLAKADDLYKKLKAGETVLNGAFDASKLGQLITEAKDIETLGKQQFQSVALQALQASDAALKLLAGGRDDGSCWDDGAEAAMPWDQYLVMATTKLLTNKDFVPALTAARDKMLEDRT